MSLSSLRPARLRWTFLAMVILLGGVALAACGGGDESASPTPVSSTDADGNAYLVVADQEERRLYVFAIPDHDLIAEFDGIEVNDHAGFLSLPDGRVLFLDDAAEDLVVLQLGDRGAEIVARAAAGPGVHLAADSELRYAAVSSGRWDDDAGMRLDPAITLVDLASYESVQFPIATGEPGVALLGDPVRLLHRNDDPAQVELFPVEAVLEGTFSFAESMPIGQAGHGEAVSHARDRFYVATDEGVEVIDVSGEAMEHLEVVPWEVSGRSGGRAFYVRLTADANLLVTYLANRAQDQAWGDWQNDAYILDLETNEAVRMPLANGYVWRMGIGDGYAIFFNLTPEGDPEGDRAYLLDLAAGSETFGTIVASIPLPALTNRAGPEPAIWLQPDIEYRRVTITPDGRYAYITNGGEGTISVIDTGARSIVATIDVPTPLSGGGSLTTVQPGAALADTIGR